MGRNCHIFSLDVRDEASYEALVDQLESIGLIPDIAINNAGLGVIAPFLETTTDDWRLTLDVNLLGVVLGCRLFAKLWIRQGISGRLVNIASMASLSPPANLSAYVASKYAVEGFSEVLAMELEEFNISISCVHPGVINTAIVADSSRMKMSISEIARLQRHYVEKGVHPRVVAHDIASGIKRGEGTILTGKDVGRTALLKRLLPRKIFRKLLLNASREMGYMPKK